MDQPFRQGAHCPGMFQATGSSLSQPGPVAMSQPFTGEKRGDGPASHFFQLGPGSGLGFGSASFFPLGFYCVWHAPGGPGKHGGWNAGAGVGQVASIEQDEGVPPLQERT